MKGDPWSWVSEEDAESQDSSEEVLSTLLAFWEKLSVTSQVAHLKLISVDHRYLQGIYYSCVQEPSQVTLLFRNEKHHPHLTRGDMRHSRIIQETGFICPSRRAASIWVLILGRLKPSLLISDMVRLIWWLCHTLCDPLLLFTNYDHIYIQELVASQATSRSRTTLSPLLLKEEGHFSF